MIKTTQHPDTGAMTKAGMSIVDAIDAPNILLDDDAANAIAQRVVQEYEIDQESRAGWVAANEEGMKIARQVKTEKTFPWPGAANVRYPLVAHAALQFASHAYPGIVDGKDVVKAMVVGPDPDGEKKKRGKRIGEHMSYQLLVEMKEWEDETDRLLAAVPITGLGFRKVWYDPILKRNRCLYIPADKLVVSDHAKNLEEAPRVTYIYDEAPRDIYELMVSGTWSDVDLPPASAEDENAPRTFLEQHRFLDLDGDGYPEPYIATVDLETVQLVRLTARYSVDGIETKEMADGGLQVLRISAEQYFVKYEFLPDPENRFHGMGFGRLLGPLNETVNASINQMLDAATLQNMGGGFLGKGAILRSGTHSFKPGEWKKVDIAGDDLRKNIVAFQFTGPSPVSLQLLSVLVDAAKDLGGIKPVLTGETGGANQAVGTMLASIEQGLKGFTATFKRIHRSLGDEYRLLARLNKLYMQPKAYYAVTDDQRAIPREDYEDNDIDVVPVSNPKLVTDMQKFGKAQLLMQFLPDPMFNPIKLRKRILDAGGVEDPDDLINMNFTKEQQEQQQKTQQMQIQLQIAEEQRKAVELKLEIAKTEAEVEEKRTRSLLNIAKAEGEEDGRQLEAYRAELEHHKVTIMAEQATAPQQGQTA